MEKIRIKTPWKNIEHIAKAFFCMSCIAGIITAVVVALFINAVIQNNIMAVLTGVILVVFNIMLSYVVMQLLYLVAVMHTKAAFIYGTLDDIYNLLCETCLVNNIIAVRDDSINEEENTETVDRD